jgi:biopolymer transport protein ExbD
LNLLSRIFFHTMPLKRPLDEMPAMNMTPMIDVVFNLIIFFMVGTQFADPERQIGLRVPQVAEHGALTVAKAWRTVNVHRNGTVVFGERLVTLAELTAQLAAARFAQPELGVLIRGDARGEFQHVAAVLNACKQAGVQELSISVRLVPLDE